MTTAETIPACRRFNTSADNMMKCDLPTNNVNEADRFSLIILHVHSGGKLRVGIIGEVYLVTSLLFSHYCRNFPCITCYLRDFKVKRRDYHRSSVITGIFSCLNI